MKIKANGGVSKWRSLRSLMMTALMLLAFSTTGSLRAGTVSVVNLPAVNTDAATGITPNKHYVCAVNFGNNGSPPANINGVSLYHFDPGAALFYTTNSMDLNFGGGFILSCSNSSIADFAGKLQRTSNGTQGSPNSQADGNTRLMLYDLMYVAAAAPSNTWLHQEYDNLTIGDQYSLRIYYRYWGNAKGDRLVNVAFNGEGSWEAYANNPVDEDAGGAHYLEYDFTAASTNVLCYMTNLIGNGSMMVYGVTLEDDSYPYAPFITYQPAATVSGNPSIFTMSAIGTGPLTYQWYMNTVSNYSGATMVTDGSGASGSTTTNLTVTENVLNYYFVVVSNNYGSVTSSITQINPRPTITSQPSSTNVGNSYVAFNMTAGGPPPLVYQWYVNTVSNYSGATALTDGNGYSGSTTASLETTTNLQDYYFVIVTNSYGSVTSSITGYNPLPTIVSQPKPFKTGSSFGFNVTGGGWPAPGYQWYVNTVSNYSGATALTDGGGVSGSSTASVTVANLTGYYYVVVSNYYGSVTSAVVELAAPLTIISAGEPIWNQASQTNVVIVFSDILDPGTATTVGNYALDNGASVLSARIGGSNEVVLGTSVLTPGTSYTLTVQNVEDFFGIPMTPSPTSLAVGTHPANIGLWVKASTGVSTDGSGNVVQWSDLSGNGNDLYGATGVFPEPQIATNAQGDAVVRFAGGANAPLLYNGGTASSLQITGDISIIAVVNFSTLDGGTNGEILSKNNAVGNIPNPYDYYVGATDGAKLYRGNGSAYGQFTSTKLPSLGTPHILVASESGDTVTHYLDGVMVGTGTLNNNFHEASCTDGGQFLYVGGRGDLHNVLSGDISELMIAGGTISSYDVSKLVPYLAQEHNINLVVVNSSPVNIVSSILGGSLTLSWPADHTGWTLQAQTNTPNAGLSANWVNVPGSQSVNQMAVPINTSNGSVFYRLVYHP